MKLVTLGAPAVIGDEPVALQPLQLAVLSYLALDGPRDRQHLASLFWQHSSNGLNSLSTTLTRIRSLAPEAVWVRGTALVGSELSTDVDEVRVAAADGDTERLLELYSAPFLSLLSLRNYSLEFEEWMLGVRSSLASEVELALLAQARADFDRGAIEPAADLAETAWTIVSRDGIVSPDFFPGYYRILASADRPLVREVRAEADDFGIDLPVIEPAPKAPSPAAAREPAVFPATSVPVIFGCVAERDAIRAAVADVGVTTLVGLGGSGKTSLAAEYFASTHAERRFDERHWVDLSAVEDADVFEASVATACGQPLAPAAHLAELFVGARRTLVVLDNFEQIVDAGSLVEDLVSTCPTVHVLVTSRVPLQLPSETVIQLRGLSLEADAQPSPAEQLFHAAAERSGAVVAINDDDTVAEICALVGGLPLALELAGSWTRVMAPGSIVDALRSSSGLLDVAPTTSQRSMDAIVRESVGALDLEHRRAIDQLATFPGGCTLIGAAALPGLSIRVIGELVSRSMVIASLDDSRVKLHPLVAQHARDHLDANVESGRELRSIQVEWCRQHIAEVAASGSASARSNLLSGLARELVNIEAAWRWSAAQERWDLIDESLEDLREFFVASARVIEGRKLFAGILDAAEAASPRPDLVARLLEATAWLTLMAGQVTRARTMLTRASAITDDVPSEVQATVLRTLGVLEFGGGNVDVAMSCFEQAQALITAESSQVLMAKLQEDMGVCHHAQGRFDDARIAFRSLLDLGREIDDHHMVASGYMRLASIEHDERPRRALVLLEEGHAIARKHNLDHLAIYFPLYAGEAHLSLGDVASAAASFREGLAASEGVGHRVSVAASHIGIAEALVATEPATAGEHLGSGIRVAVETNCAPYVMWAAYVVAALQLGAGSQSPLASDMLRLAATHATTEPAVRRRALDAMERFGIASGPAPDMSDAGHRVDEIGEQLLEVLRFG